MKNPVKALLCLAFLVALGVLSPGQAHGKTIYPDDRYIKSIEFEPKGVNIKLTTLGLTYGSLPNGAKGIAERVRNWHEKATRGCSGIRVSKLALQIEAHALAYWAGGFSRVFPTRLAVLTKMLGKSLRERANPINITWREIT